MESTYLLAKAIVKPWVGLWCRVAIEGLEHIPRKGPAILAFNHIAFLDPLVTAYVVDKANRRPRYLAKSELFDDRRIAWILRGAGQIPVKRGTKEAPMALDEAVKALERGEIVVVFPEGTITRDPDLHPMEAKTGVARLSALSGLPVFPCAVWGTANLWPKGYRKSLRLRQDVCVRIDEPMDLGVSDDPDSWKEGGKRLMDRISLLVASLRPIVPDRRRPKRAA